MVETQEILIKKIEEKARLICKHSLEMALVVGSKGVHLGSGNSMAEIMATLYTVIMRRNLKILYGLTVSLFCIILSQLVV